MRTNRPTCLEESGVSAVQPEAAVVDFWMAQVDGIFHQTMLPQAQSWWRGSNIPGKPPQFLFFVGGFAAYRDLCEQWFAEGLPGYRLDGMSIAEPQPEEDKGLVAAE